MTKGKSDKKPMRQPCGAKAVGRGNGSQTKGPPYGDGASLAWLMSNKNSKLPKEK
jgi:hypothetical protein